MAAEVHWRQLLSLRTATKGAVPVLEELQRMWRKTGSNNSQRVPEVAVINVPHLERSETGQLKIKNRN